MAAWAESFWQKQPAGDFCVLPAEPVAHQKR